eukprot:15333223-Alexandrium_andersonii.AAC.1
MAAKRNTRRAKYIHPKRLGEISARQERVDDRTRAPIASFVLGVSVQPVHVFVQRNVSVCSMSMCAM